MKIPTHIYHYYEIDNGPFKNLTEYGKDRALEIQQNISVGFNSQRPANYVELRFALEKRLKDQFVSKGGVVTRNDPYYFTLGPCEWVSSIYINPGVVKIPLADINPNHISFTYPDSMVSFQFHDEPKLATYRKECNGKIFTLRDLKGLVDEYGIPSKDKWESEEKMKYDRYIEVQVWDNSFLHKLEN